MPNILGTTVTNFTPVIKSAGTAYTAHAGEAVIVTTGAAFTVTLPASPIAGQQVTVKDGANAAGGFNITVLPSAGTIDGLASYALHTNGASAIFTYSGTMWVVSAAANSSTSSNFRNAILGGPLDTSGRAATLLGGLSTVNSATTARAISGGDFSGQPKANAFDGNLVNSWQSSQTGTGISGAAYIGQDTGIGNTVSIGAFTLYNDNSATVSIASVLFQTSPDGTTWTTRETIALSTTAFAINSIQLAQNYVVRAWRLLANANLGAGLTWNVRELQAYGYVGSAPNVVDLVSPVILSFAAGYNADGTPADPAPTVIVTDRPGLWSGLIANQTNHLFADRNPSTGAITGVASLFPMVFSTATPSVVSPATNYWALNEASGTVVADSIGGANGTATGTTVAAGKYGNARSFNGTSDYVMTTLVPTPTTYSIAAWINPNSVAPASPKAIVGDDTSGGTGVAYRVNLFMTTAGKLSATFGNGAASTTVTFAPTLSATAWTHAVMTVDGTNARLYLNGLLADTQAQGTALAGTGSGHLAIGRLGDQADYFWNGLIDEVYYFQNYVLSAGEIYNLANGGANPPLYTGKHWYNPATSLTQFYTGSAWSPVQRLPMGLAANGATNVASVTGYAVDGLFASGRVACSASTSYTIGHNLGLGDLINIEVMEATSTGGSLRPVAITGRTATTVSFTTGSGAVEYSIVARRAF